MEVCRKDQDPFATLLRIQSQHNCLNSQLAITCPLLERPLVASIADGKQDPSVKLCRHVQPLALLYRHLVSVWAGN